MNISRTLVGALLVCALPALAQPDEKPAAKPPFPIVSPEEAAKLGLTDKPMTFHLRDVTLRDALGELQHQSSVPIELQWGGGEQLDKKLSLDLETRSFNEAFRAILDEADVKARLQRWSGVTWNLQFGAEQEADDAPQSGVSPFQLRAANLSYSFSRYVTPGKDAAPKRGQSESVSVTFSLPSDPQLPIVKTPKIRVSRAEDEAGRSLLLAPDPNRPDFDYGGSVQQQTNASLRVPEKTSHKLAHLEGVATFVLASRREHWEVPDVLNAKTPAHTFSSSGQQVTASVVSVEKKRGALEVEFQLKAVGVLDLNDGQTLEGRNPMFSFERLGAAITIHDAKGAVLSSQGYSGSGGNNSYTIQLRFPLNAPDAEPKAAPATTEPFTLVFDAPSEFVQTEVPFSFSNLPLP